MEKSPGFLLIVLRMHTVLQLL